MAQFNRWWDSLGKAERIVAISLGLSAPIAIVNSTVWAIATTTMYIARQRARVEVERVRAAAHATPQADHELEGERATSTR
jgi:hypothetical protein